MSVERLAPAVRELLRAEIAAALGREVSFVARLDANGLIVDARVVARGTVDAVLALPGIAVRGELLARGRAPPRGSTRSTSRRCSPRAAPWPARWAASRIARASAT
ncbi:MAG: hypothetical protein DMD70_02470 [Gemmatimonadetes bacterium]|nr:MAG: hypothetical protein DMD70_02470 [Gemmatimonadota bacterium]